MTSQIWFWIVAVEAAVLLAMVACDWAGWATTSLIFTAAALYFAGTNVLVFATENWVWLLSGAAVYFPLGVGWSMVKWYLYLVDAREQHVENVATVKAALIKRLRDRGRPESFDMEWISSRPQMTAPIAKQHKSRIICWIAYWPVSLFWSVIHDMVESIAKNLFNLISKTYQRISDKVFSEFKESE